MPSEPYEIPENPEENDNKNLLAAKTVLVLGAGASHGSSLVGSIRPPLIRNFFDCAHKLRILNKKDFKQIWHYLEKEGGIPFKRLLQFEADKFVNIEQIYSLISELDNNGAIKKLIERFFYEVLTATTRIYKDKTCEFHDILLKILQPEVIISFNYDLIIDRSLSTLYPGWEEDQISKFNRVYNGKKFVDTEEYLPVDPEESKKIESKIFPLLFKLHGSLNHYYDITMFELTRSRKRWLERRTDYIVPLKYAFDIPRIYQQRTLRDFAPSTIQSLPPGSFLNNGTAELNLDMIPPIWNKEVQDWSSAIHELCQAKKLVFIGYSMSDIDLWALRMFRVSYQRHNHKKDLEVEVIGDESSCERVKSVYYDTPVQNSFKTLEEYARGLIK